MVKLPSSIEPAGVYAACVLLPTVATVTVCMRFWVRRMRKNKFGSDDWTILLGLLLMWTTGGIILTGVSEKVFGYHTMQDPQTGADIVTYKEHHQVKLTTIILLIHTLTLGFIKLSIVFLYRRLFATNRAFNVWSEVLCAVIALWTLSFFFAALFQCGVHFSAFWTSGKTLEKYCDQEPVTTTTFCITDVLTDLIILVTPLPMIWKLHMSLAQKIGLCSVFVLGILSTVAGIIRAVLTGIFELGTEEGFRDLLAANTIIVVWCIIEAASAIIGACLPTIRPLFQSKAVEDILRSMQSFFSLRGESRPSSNRSYKSAGSHEQGHNLDDEIALRVVSKDASKASVTAV